MSFVRITGNQNHNQMTARLEQFIKSRQGQRAEFTLDDLYEQVHPENRDDFIVAIGKLVHRGKLKQLIRVISPRTQTGIRDFDSLKAIPSVINDWRTDTQFTVTPDDIRIIYVVPSKKE